MYKAIIIICLVFFGGCTVKVLTFGTEKALDHQDIIIGSKKSNQSEVE